MDRGFHDILTWLNVRFQFNEITVEQKDLLLQCLEPYTDLVTKTFFFELPVENSLARHQLIKKQQEVDDLCMNAKWLNTLNKVYLEQNLNAIVINGHNSMEETQEELRRYIE